MIRKLFADSVSSAIVPLVKLAITFIMAPLIVHSLGNYDYGIWEIVFSVIAYMEFLDFGLMPAIVRNVARCNALKDYDELHRIYSSSLVFFVPVGLLMAAGLLCFAWFSPEVFIKSPNPDNYKYTLFFVIISVQVFFVFVGSVFDCYFEGLQLYSLRNYLTIVFSIAGALIMYPLLQKGNGLLVLATVNTCGFALKYIIYGVLLSTRKFGGFRFRISSFSGKTLGGLFNFGVKSFVWALSLRIGTLTDPMVIGAFLGASAVPFYMIPSNFVGQARGLIWSVTKIFLPAFSGLDALKEKEKVRSLYFGASRYMLGIIVPLNGGIALLGPSFLEHWMGREYAAKGLYVLYIITAVQIFSFMNPFCKRFLTAIDRHEILARVGVISATVNLALSICLVQQIGIEGVALGTLVPTMIFEPYLLYKSSQELGSTVMEYLRSVLLPLVLPTAGFTLFLCVLVSKVTVQSLFDVLWMAIASMLLYTPLFFVFSMKCNERQSVFCTVRNLLSKVN
jgi:O-antigen/teichoic acid export membrane protein